MRFTVSTSAPTTMVTSCGVYGKPRRKAAHPDPNAEYTPAFQSSPATSRPAASIPSKPGKLDLPTRRLKNSNGYSPARGSTAP